MPGWLLDPNIVYIILLAGIWLSITASYMPGTGVLEVVAIIAVAGAVLLLVAMPTFWPGVLIMLAGSVVFFGLPFLRPKAVLLALVGLAAQAVGSLLMFPSMPVSLLLVGTISALSLAYFYFALLPALNTHWHKGELLDDTSMIGELGQVLRPLNPVGVVRVRGESWTGRVVPADQVIAIGQPVRVVDHENLTLFVEAVKPKRTGEAPPEADTIV